MTAQQHTTDYSFTVDATTLPIITGSNITYNVSLDDMSGCAFSAASTAPPSIITLYDVRDNKNQKIVEIEADGTVKLGEGVSTNEAASFFWNRVVEESRIHIEHVNTLKRKIEELEATVAALSAPPEEERTPSEQTIDDMCKAYERAMGVLR